MRKIILGLVAAAAIVTPIAATTTVANAATTATTACTPSAATPRIDHIEYQWVAAVAKPKLHLEYKWTSTSKNPSTDLAHVWLRSLDTTKRGLPQVTRTVIDQPAHAAVTCGVTLPTSFVDQTTCQSPIASAVVPVTPGVKTFLKGVRGYDERVAIDHDVTVTSAMAGQFWVGHEANDGYVISNPDTAAWHVDFQFSCAFDVPTVVDGVPQYGASSNGTWKLGSKVTLTSGSEFQTHGGTDLSGPVTRYRLVFTPASGYVLPSSLPNGFTNVAGSAVYFVYVGQSDVRLTEATSISKHIDLPDAFPTEHAADGFPGYYSTRIPMAITNDSDVDMPVNVMYADQQDGNRVWIERGVFENWTNSMTIPAHSTKVFTFDVWYDAPVGSPEDVPNDLTLDFVVNATIA